MRRNRALGSNGPRHTREEKIVLAITTGIFIVYSITLIYPFIWAIFTSFKTQGEVKNNLFGLPKTWVFDSVGKALSTKGENDATLIGMFFNSVWTSFLCAFCSVFVSTMTAYVITKYRFVGSKLFLPIAIILQALPLVGTMPAMFGVVRALGMVDNPLLFWIVWCGGFGYSFILLCGYFRGVSWEYAEAAFIDGASHAAVFFRIMVPLAFPAIFSLFLVSFISAWNDYFTVYLYLPSYQTLAVGVYRWKLIAAQNGGTPVYMAAVVLSVIPVMVLYAAFQKTIMGTSLGGGIKE